MDIAIKSENEILMGLDTQSCEFLNEMPKVYKVAGGDEHSVPNEETAAEDVTNELSMHAKKILLRAFKRDGCTQETLKQFCLNHKKAHKINVQLANEYFDSAAKDAQNFVYQECDSLSFNNITEWLKFLQASDGPQHCNYEAAIVLNAISNSEFHPAPDVMDNVDLKAIYKFLSYALLGLPQEQLDDASARFLSNEFQNLIDEANTDEADNDVRNMKRRIEDSLDNNCAVTINSHSRSLDPLNIAELNEDIRRINNNFTNK